MKLINLLFTAVQIAVALSDDPSGRRSPKDDGRGTINVSDLAKRENILEARTCWYGADYGCSRDGYCWRNCGPHGEWCWLAADNGNGPWLKCVDKQQCAPGLSVIGTASCGKGNCDACGCSC